MSGRNAGRFCCFADAHCTPPAQWHGAAIIMAGWLPVSKIVREILQYWRRCFDPASPGARALQISYAEEELTNIERDHLDRRPDSTVVDSAETRLDTTQQHPTRQNAESYYRAIWLTLELHLHVDVPPSPDGDAFRDNIHC